MTSVDDVFAYHERAKQVRAQRATALDEHYVALRDTLNQRVHEFMGRAVANRIEPMPLVRVPELAKRRERARLVREQPRTGWPVIDRQPYGGRRTRLWIAYDYSWWTETLMAGPLPLARVPDADVLSTIARVCAGWDLDMPLGERLLDEPGAIARAEDAMARMLGTAVFVLVEDGQPACVYAQSRSSA